MIPLTLHDIALATGGEVHGDPAVQVWAPASLDSRAVEPGGLFVAIAGEQVDGHAYAAAAHEAGAAAVLAARPTPAPTVVVADPATALGRLARHVLDRLDPLVLALTGSQGKTGTKDYLAQVLASAGETVATRGNLNNELGVPLTVLRADERTRYLVVEMGARGIGHISYLCDLAPPHVAAVLNVGDAHVGEFGGQANIARAKGEIVEALSGTGTAVLNADDDLVRAMSGRTGARTLTFGETGEVSWRDVAYDDLGRPAFVLTHGERSAAVSLRQVGAHQVANAAAAAAMALAAGLDLEQIAGALSAAEARSRWRMEVTERADGLLVVNDAYNANPASMRAALDALAQLKQRSGRRAVAVLGAMRELGEAADAAHRELGRYAAERGVDVLVTVGAEAEQVAAGAAAAGLSPVRTPGRDAALEWLRKNATGVDAVLVKASRGIALEVVVAGLLAADTGEGAQRP